MNEPITLAMAFFWGLIVGGVVCAMAMRAAVSKAKADLKVANELIERANEKLDIAVATYNLLSERLDRVQEKAK